MGGSQSQVNNSKVITRTLSQLIVNSTTRCLSTIYGAQTQEYTNTTANGVTQIMSLSIKITCDITQEFINKMQDSIRNELTQMSTSSSPAIIGALQKTTNSTSTEIINELTNIVNIGFMTELSAGLNAVQTIKATGSNLSNIRQELTMEVVNQLVQKQLQNSELVRKLDNAVEVATTTKVTNPISDIIDSAGNALFGGSGILLPLVIAGAAIGGIYFATRKSSSGVNIINAQPEKKPQKNMDIEPSDPDELP